MPFLNWENALHIIKTDDGTEHALIEPFHIYLLSINEEEEIENAFSNATSPQNQRIEAYSNRIDWVGGKDFYRTYQITTC